MLSYLRSFFIIPSDKGQHHTAIFTRYQDKDLRISDVRIYPQFELSCFDFNFRNDIKHMELWKVPLFEWLPVDLGFLYHAYIVFETEDKENTTYWSLEKAVDQKVHIQQSAHKNDVIEYFAGKRRLRNFFWRPHRMTYIGNCHVNIIEMKHLFYEHPKYVRFRCLDTKYFAQDAFNLLCTGNNTCNEVFSTTGYILDSVKNALNFPFEYYLKASAYIVFCFYNSLYAAGYLGIFCMLSCIRSCSDDQKTAMPTDSSIKSRFQRIYKYD